jgi:hypothetical protein
MTDIQADMRDLSEGRRGSLIDARPWLTKTVVAAAIVVSAASASVAKDGGLTLDSPVLRKHQAAIPTTTGSGASRQSSGRHSDPAKVAPASSECPVVKYKEDGLIDYVIVNC